MEKHTTADQSTHPTLREGGRHIRCARGSNACSRAAALIDRVRCEIRRGRRFLPLLKTDAPGHAPFTGAIRAFFGRDAFWHRFCYSPHYKRSRMLNEEHIRSSKPFRIALQEEARFAATDGESVSRRRAGVRTYRPAGSPETAEGKHRVLNVEDQLLRFHGEGASVRSDIRMGIPADWVNRVGDARAGRGANASPAGPSASSAAGDGTYAYRRGSGAVPAPRLMPTTAPPPRHRPV